MMLMRNILAILPFVAVVLAAPLAGPAGRRFDELLSRRGYQFIPATDSIPFSQRGRHSVLRQTDWAL